jgi:3-methylfumaryl-CoA hydratase
MQESNFESQIKVIERCSPTMVRRVAAMLDLETSSFSEGDILPKGWHFFMLAGETRKTALRADGFPGLGVPIPDLGLPRLLLGGRTVNYQADIIIGDEIERTSFVKEIKEKTTINGRMAIVTIQHELRPVLQEQPAIVETQTYILLEEQKVKNLPVFTNDELRFTIEKKENQIIPNETLLFQYSALGFNSHKIHLDRDYARKVEGLPDLVVNGGLATILMTEFVRNELKLNLVEIKVKHVAPLYCNRPLTIVFEENELKIYNDKNEIAVIMEIAR